MVFTDLNVLFFLSICSFAWYYFFLFIFTVRHATKNDKWDVYVARWWYSGNLFFLLFLKLMQFFCSDIRYYQMQVSSRSITVPSLQLFICFDSWYFFLLSFFLSFFLLSFILSFFPFFLSFFHFLSLPHSSLTYP